MTGDQWTSMLSSVVANFSDFSSTNLLSIIAAALGITIPVLLTWFAFRWIFGKIKAAFYFGA